MKGEWIENEWFDAIGNLFLGHYKKMQYIEGYCIIESSLRVMNPIYLQKVNNYILYYVDDGMLYISSLEYKKRWRYYGYATLILKHWDIVSTHGKKCNAHQVADITLFHAAYLCKMCEKM